METIIGGIGFLQIAQAVMDDRWVDGLGITIFPFPQHSLQGFIGIRLHFTAQKIISIQLYTINRRNIVENVVCTGIPLIANMIFIFCVFD